jgi:hypothetical protein
MTGSAIPSSAAPGVPPGAGLVGDFEAFCPDLGGTVLFTFTRGQGGPSWLQSTGERFLIVREEFTGEITAPDGTVTPIQETASFGKKAGLGSTITCTASIDTTLEDGSTVVGTVEATLVEVPPS